MKNNYSLRSFIGLVSLLWPVFLGQFAFAQTPVITGFAPVNNPVCTESAATFTATIGNFSGDYDWRLTNGASVIGVNSVTAATISDILPGAGSGIQSYTLTVTSAGQSVTATTSLTVVSSDVTRLYVKANATGANTGLNWDDAFTDLQSALKYPCLGSLREIWIARGVYKPRSALISDAFSMLPDVAIYGGFEGIEDDLNERPPITLTNPSSTTLSADIDNDGTVANNSHYLIYNNRHLTSTAILDGAVITPPQSGTETGTIMNKAGTQSGFGAECSPQFRNLLFTGYVYNGTFEGSSSLFVHNQVLSGGVVNPSFINCVFRDNQGQLGGSQTGSLWTYAASGTANLSFLNCVFANSTGSQVKNNQVLNGQIEMYFSNCSFLNLPDGITENVNNVTSTPINVELSNCVLWNTGGSNTFRIVSGVGSQTVTAQYSLLDQSITGYTSGPGNLTAISSPYLSATDVNLPNSSSAVNAGDPNSMTVASAPYSATNLPATDAAAKPRIVGGRVDMGALEVQSPPVCGTVVYVSQNGAGSQNGSSWTNAFSGTALQTAINTAATCGAQVWVAQGLYKPTTGTDPTISFMMKEGVGIYGGFRGTEGQLGERPAVNPVTGQPSSSTLSGDIGTPGNSGEDSDNSGHVISNGPGLTASAVLDGFVISRGNASNTQDGIGGGIYNRSANPTIRNCFFFDNYGVSGGAIYNQDSGPLTINCRFESNKAFPGGAIYNNGTSSLTVTACAFVNNTGNVGGAIRSNGSIALTIENSSFQGNSAENGGAISDDPAVTKLELTNCLFENNTSERGGSIEHSGASPIVLRQCQFTNNSVSREYGGAIYSEASLEAIECRFTGNSAVYEGGAISSYGSSLKLTRCVFEDNLGGGDGGGAVFVSTGSATIVNTRFVSNTATYGGAIYFYGENHNLLNCSFVDNVATEQGGAVNNYAQSIRLTNNSFQNNQAPQGGAYYSEYQRPARLINSVLFNNGGANSLVLTSGASLSVSYSLFEPSVTGYADGANNLTTTLSPFVSTTSTQLRGCSQAINTGSNPDYNAVSGPATDLAGNTRFFNSGIIDRGAYEYQGNPAALTVMNPSVQLAVLNQPFSQTFTASGGSSPYSFSVLGSNLPASLSLSPTGVLSGNPTQSGSYSVLVAAQSADGCIGTSNSTYNLTVGLVCSTVAGPITASGLASCSLPARLTAPAVGRSFIFTGPDGYVFSNVYRTVGSYTALGNDVKLGGTYTLTVYGEEGCPPVSRSVIVEGASKCP